jgi:hypothetical protein
MRNQLILEKNLCIFFLIIHKTKLNTLFAIILQIKA